MLAEARAALAALAAGVPARPGAVRFTTSGPLGILELDNPASRNAMTLGMMVGLADAVDRALGSGVSVVTVVGAGDRAFCAGGQLDELVSALDRPEQARAMCRAMGAVLDAFAASPFVSIAAVDGPAIGGGAEVATACDHVLVGPAGFLHFAQVGLGVAAGWGAVRRLVRRVGPQRALALVASDARFTAEPGFAEPALPTGRHGAAVLAERYAALPAVALRAVKRQISAALAGDPESDAEAFAETWGGPDHVAALARRRRRAE